MNQDISLPTDSGFFTVIRRTRCAMSWGSTRPVLVLQRTNHAKDDPHAAAACADVATLYNGAGGGVLTGKTALGAVAGAASEDMSDGSDFLSWAPEGRGMNQVGQRMCKYNPTQPRLASPRPA